MRAHAEAVPIAVPNRLPEFVKQMTWDSGRDLLAHSVWIGPLRFDPGRALDELRLWRRYLDTIAELVRGARTAVAAAGFQA